MSLTHSVPRRGLPLLACALASSVVLAACGSSNSGTSGATTKLTVGFVVDPSWAQIPVAEQTGLFTKQGIDVKVVNFATGVDALDALKAGVVDVTTAADVPTSAAIAKDPRVDVIADGSVWNGSKIVARKASGITAFTGLAGKKVGTPLGTSAGYFAAKAFASDGIEAKLVQTAPPTMIAAITRGDIDAVSIFQPYQAQVEDALAKKGGAIVLDAPGSPYRQHSLYLALKTTAQAKAPALKKFLAAIAQADKPLTEASPDAIAAVAKATTLSPKVLRRILPEFAFKSQLPIAALARQLTELGTWSKANKYLAADVTLPDYTGRLNGALLPAGA